MVKAPFGGKNYKLIPGCSTKEDGTVECEPKRKNMETGETEDLSEEPMVFKKGEVRGKEVMIIKEEGGADKETIDRMREYVRNRYIEVKS